MPEIIFEAKLGSILRPKDQPLEGEASFEAALTGRVCAGGGMERFSQSEVLGSD